MGVPPDYVEAYKWFTLAEGKGSADAGKAKELAAARMTPAQMAEARQRASDWARDHPPAR
jgi:TPR repeat protein